MSKRIQKTTATDWVKSSRYSLVNDREHAIYLLGKEKGAEEYRQQFDDIFNLNFSKSYAHTSDVLKKISEYNIDVISARLKVNSVKSLNVIISLRESDALFNHIENVYDFLYDIENKVNTDEYNINFSIVKANAHFSDEHVENDGYIYNHRLEVDEESTRTA